MNLKGKTYTNTNSNKHRRTRTFSKQLLNKETTMDSNIHEHTLSAPPFTYCIGLFLYFSPPVFTQKRTYTGTHTHTNMN